MRKETRAAPVVHNRLHLTTPPCRHRSLSKDSCRKCSRIDDCFVMPYAALDKTFAGRPGSGATALARRPVTRITWPGEIKAACGRIRRTSKDRRTAPDFRLKPSMKTGGWSGGAVEGCGVGGARGRRLSANQGRGCAVVAWQKTGQSCLPWLAAGLSTVTDTARTSRSHQGCRPGGISPWWVEAKRGVSGLCCRLPSCSLRKPFVP
jgi:hypothetical protein